MFLKNQFQSNWNISSKKFFHVFCALILKVKNKEKHAEKKFLSLFLSSLKIFREFKDFWRGQFCDVFNLVCKHTFFSFFPAFRFTQRLYKNRRNTLLSFENVLRQIKSTKRFISFSFFQLSYRRCVHITSEFFKAFSGLIETIFPPQKIS